MARREQLSGSTGAANEAERLVPASRDQGLGDGDTLSDASFSESIPQLRIDAPHVLGDRPLDPIATEADSPMPADGAAAAAEPHSVPHDAADSLTLPAENVPQLRLQAEQLAAHLRTQEYQLDRRESQLHSELAQQENNVRGMRLWFQERQQDLAEREAELARRAEQLDQRQNDLALLENEFELRQAQWLAESQTPFELADATTGLSSSAGEAETLEQQLADRTSVAALAAAEAGATIAAAEAAAAKQQADQRLADATRIHRQLLSMLRAARRFLGEPTIEVAGRPLPATDVLPDDGRATTDLLRLDAELRAALEQLAARQQNLEAAEVLLADGQAELDRGRRQLTADRQAWEEQCEAERGRLADDCCRQQTELDRRLALLLGREEHLSRRSAAVDQLRTEVLRAQRETLELRLATDEVWAQLASSVPPPALTQSLVRTRSQLAEQSRREQLEVQQQRTELEVLAQRLSEQHEKLTAQRQEIEARGAEQRHEIERHAAGLAAREQDFERRQVDFAQLCQRHDGERRVYEAEIRRLLAELRRRG